MPPRGCPFALGVVEDRRAGDVVVRAWHPEWLGGLTAVGEPVRVRESSTQAGGTFGWVDVLVLAGEVPCSDRPTSGSGRAR